MPRGDVPGEAGGRVHVVLACPDAGLGNAGTELGLVPGLRTIQFRPAAYAAHSVGAVGRVANQKGQGGEGGTIQVRLERGQCGEHLRIVGMYEYSNIPITLRCICRFYLFTRHGTRFVATHALIRSARWRRLCLKPTA